MRNAIVGAALLAVAVACGTSTTTSVSASTTTNYSASLTGAKEVPSVTTNGAGTFTASLNTSTKVLTVTLSVTGMSSNVTLAHIHGPASTATSAGVILNLNPTTGGTAGTLVNGV